MKLFIHGLENSYEIEMLSRMFFPLLSLGALSDFPDENDDYILAEREITGEKQCLCIKLHRNGVDFEESGFLSADADEREYTLYLSRMLYRCCVKSGCDELRWGILTGIRPIKLFHALYSKGRTESEINAEIKRDYLISDEMAELAQKIRRTEHEINKMSVPMGFSLYVSIPFCPQRCSYCSFVSQSVDKMKHLIEPYVEQLCVELREFGETAKRLGLILQTIYFGGGTPTTLSAEQLTRLFEAIADSFDLSHLLEYTVEAGRPDTIDRERLIAIKNAGVTRLSVNPQTMNDNVLRAVGRRHSSQQVEEAFHLAREIGFDNINMDLIAGLPEDTPESFESSLKRVLALDPDNITVHSLTLKRSSTLVEQGAAKENYRRREETAKMVDTARRLICEAGYSPYYLYRQKNTVGSLDNTGYAKAGREGLYNIFIMDETHTILAAGAGAVTKLKAPYGQQIERIYNYKFPAEYIERYEILRQRKERVAGFYEDNKQV